LVAADIPALSYEPIDATIVRTGQTNYIDLTDGGATTLHSHAAGVFDALGNGSKQYQVPITGATPFAPVYSGFLLDGTTGGKTSFAVTNNKTLTLTATDDFNLTIPATGTAALLATENAFTAENSGITPTLPASYATKAYVDLAVSSLHLTEFFSAVALSPAVGTFLSMDNAESAAGTVQSVDITGSIGTPTAIFKWLTPAGHPHLDRIPAGSFDIHAHLLKTTTAPNNKIVAIYAEIWQNTAAGVHTAKIATSATYQGFTTVDTFYDIYATVAAEFPLAVTDRISIEFFGYVISGTGQNKLTMTVGGTADSHMEIGINSSELQAIFVPYTGAEHDVDLATKTLTAAELISTLSGTITRTSGYISSVAKTGGRTLTVTRDGSNLISTIADGTRTWTFTRTANIITSWSVA